MPGGTFIGCDADDRGSIRRAPEELGFTAHDRAPLMTGLT
mgnify:CR=1 FL=1